MAARDNPDMGSRPDWHAVVDNFEAAWQQGQRPTIAQFLGQENLTGEGRRALLLELAHVEFELRLKAGERARVEEYLAAWPELAADRDATSELIQQEYHLRLLQKPKPTVEEYARRFPGFSLDLTHVPKDRLRRGRLPIRLNCPHCCNPIQVVSENEDEEVVCPSCGSSFNLDPNRTQTWSPDKLPKLGKFDLLNVLGRGAFGTVYRARDNELQRTVALKIPRSGTITSTDDEARFMREARNAAQLHHPGIVPVFEVGRSENFPYIVSEFVEGVTLSDTLTGRRFGFAESAELVAQIAEALDHAHRLGVVHRDLKPSNIMLTATGQPRIMDFGLAKREAGEITMTLEGQVLGTPAYMSPEQAGGKAHSVDGRSDVYSLGVILFELLTGELPFRGNQRMLLHQVLNDDPRSPRSLNDRIPRDLETICLKAMAKEPPRRYQTAAEFTADVRRYRAGEPILARPISSAERAWRWARRKPLAASLLGSLLILLCVLTVATFLISQAYHREAELARANKRLADAASAARLEIETKQAETEAARLEAVSNGERALQEKKSANEVVDFLLGLFQSADPVGLHGSGFRGANQAAGDVRLRDVLDRGLARIQRELVAQPLVRARLVTTLGDVYRSLGLNHQALELIEEGRALREKHKAPPVDLADSYFHLAFCHQWNGNNREAETFFHQALEIQDKLALSPETQLAIARTKFHLGWLLNDMNQHEQAERLFRDVLIIRRERLAPEHPDIMLAEYGLYSILWSRGDKPVLEEFSRSPLKDDFKVQSYAQYMAAYSARQLGNYVLAESIYRSLLASWERQFSPSHPLVAILKADAAGMLREKGDYRGAEILADDAFPVLRQFAGNHGKFQDAQRVYAEALASRGAHRKARALYADILAVQLAHQPRDWNNVTYAVIAVLASDIEAGDFDHAITLGAIIENQFPHLEDVAWNFRYEVFRRIATAYWERGEFRPAETWFERAWEALRPAKQELEEVCFAHELADFFRDAGAADKRRKFVDIADGNWKAWRDVDPLTRGLPNDFNYLHQFARACAAQGDHLRAATFLERAAKAESSNRKYPSDHPVIAGLTSRGASELLLAGDQKRAEEQCLLAKKMFLKHVGAEHGLVVPCLLDLTRIQVAREKWDEANATCDQIRKILEHHDAPPARWRVATDLALAGIFSHAGKHDSAARLLQGALEQLASFPQAHPLVHQVQLALARSQLAGGKASEATQRVRSLIEENFAKLPPDSWRRAEEQELLGDCLAAAKEQDGARKAYTAALVIYRDFASDGTDARRVQKLLDAVGQ